MKAKGTFFSRADESDRVGLIHIQIIVIQRNFARGNEIDKDG